MLALTGPAVAWLQVRYEDEDEDEGPQPDPTLEQGVPVPVRMQGGFPSELSSTPLEDIDSYYHNQKVKKPPITFQIFSFNNCLSHWKFARVLSVGSREAWKMENAKLHPDWMIRFQQIFLEVMSKLYHSTCAYDQISSNLSAVRNCLNVYRKAR